MNTNPTFEPEAHPDPDQASSGQGQQGIPPAVLDWRLFSIVSAILILLTVLFIFGIRLQSDDYQKGISAAYDAKPIDHAAMLAYNRAFGATIIKTSGLFLGYLLVFIGVLFVLRSSEVSYNLAVESKDIKGTLQTTSPGLVIITLGVVLIAITILSKSSIGYKAPPSGSAAGANTNQQDLQQVETSPTL